MRIKLNSDKMFFDSIKIINTVLQNILKNPGQLKYSRLRLSNEKIMKHIDSVEQARFIMEMMGFEQQMLPSGENFDGPVDKYLVLEDTKADPRDMNHLCSIIQDILGKNSLKPLTTKINLDPQLMKKLSEQEKV